MTKIITDKIVRSGKGKSRTEEVVEHSVAERPDEVQEPNSPSEEQTTLLIPKPIPDDDTFKLFNLLNSGYEETELRPMFPTWPTRKFNALLERAKELVAKSVQDTEKEKAGIVAKYKHLYKLAMSVNNAKEARQILDSLTKVLGLTKDVNVNDGTFIAVWK
jgi:hypothetical protein